MKKNKYAIAITLLAIIGGFGIYKSQRQAKMSAIMMANVEALAQGEGGSGQKLDCWDNISGQGNVLATHITYCLTCDPILAKSWSKEGMCVDN